MLMLTSTTKADLKAGLFILQCVQLGIIQPAEARNMLFLNEVGEKK